LAATAAIKVKGDGETILKRVSNRVISRGTLLDTAFAAGAAGAASWSGQEFQYGQFFKNMIHSAQDVVNTHQVIAHTCLAKQYLTLAVACAVGRVAWRPVRNFVETHDVTSKTEAILSRVTSAIATVAFVANWAHEKLINAHLKDMMGDRLHPSSPDLAFAASAHSMKGNTSLMLAVGTAIICWASPALFNAARNRWNASNPQLK
jgi:hypothetical protein